MFSVPPRRFTGFTGGRNDQTHSPDIVVTSNWTRELVWLWLGPDQAKAANLNPSTSIQPLMDVLPLQIELSDFRHSKLLPLMVRSKSNPWFARLGSNRRLFLRTITDLSKRVSLSRETNNSFFRSFSESPVSPLSGGNSAHPNHPTGLTMLFPV